MKHIAVLSTLYYPDMGAPSACIDKYVQALGDDYLFHIITRTDCSDFEPSKEYDVRYITSFRHRLILRCRDNVKRGHKVFLYKLILGFINLCKLIQAQYSFPSAQRWEVNQYAKQLEKLDKEVGVNIVFTVSNTAFPQLATLRFKKHHPEVKWLSFFYDPYSPHYIYYKYKLFRAILECIPIFVGGYYLNLKRTEKGPRFIVAVSMITPMILPLTTIIHMILRVSFYFSIFYLATIPITYKEIRNGLLRNILLFLVMFLTFYVYIDRFNNDSYRKPYEKYQTIFSVL